MESNIAPNQILAEGPKWVAFENMGEKREGKVMFGYLSVDCMKSFQTYY